MDSRFQRSITDTSNPLVSLQEHTLSGDATKRTSSYLLQPQTLMFQDSGSHYLLDIVALQKHKQLQGGPRRLALHVCDALSL